MAYKYSQRSIDNLSSAHPIFTVLMTAVLVKYDHTITCGLRGEEEQNEAFRNGWSTLKWPLSKHNKYPSLAIDAGPFIDNKLSKDIAESAVFGIHVVAMADELGIPIRWGGDWDGDGNLREHKLRDYRHFELDVERFRKTPWFQMYGL